MPWLSPNTFTGWVGGVGDAEGPGRGNCTELGFSLGMTPCSALSSQPSPGATLRSAQRSGPALTPDLPPAIIFNTREKKREGTNHCNYVQWVLPWWLCKICSPWWLPQRLARDTTRLRGHTAALIGRAHWTDINNSKLTSETSNRGLFCSPNCTLVSLFGYNLTLWRIMEINCII